MSKLSNNDKTYGPLTIGSWYKNFSLRFSSGLKEDEDGNHLLITGFGKAFRLKMPTIISEYRGKYEECSKDYGISLTCDGNGYDFFQLFFGPQTNDSSTTKSWSKFLPWKQWDCVRQSLYSPDGTHFADIGRNEWLSDIRKDCPKSHFKFEDYDGEIITASCSIEEREWHRGEGWFKWLKYFYPAKIRRSLDISFNKEVGSEKGSWKGGTLGHGIDITKDESIEDAFKRYCYKGHDGKYRKTPLKFIGSCEAPTNE